MYSYIAVVHKNPDSDYGASFPDLPGCVTAASTIEELRHLAREALGLHLEGMLEDAAELPPATTPEAIAASEESDRAVAIFEVKVAHLKQGGNRSEH